MQVTKCLRLSRKVSALIQPDGWAKPRHPEGPPRVMDGRNFFLRKIKTGGMCVPAAHMKANIVVFTPRSCETVCCTCFDPFVATIFGGGITVGIPVSSVFQMRKIGKRYWIITDIKLSKNRATTGLLNQLARLWLVASGARIDKVAFRLRKAVNQSPDAASEFFQFVETLILLDTAKEYAS